MGLRSVLDEEKTVATRERAQGLDRTQLPVEVDRNHRRRPR